VTDRGKLLLELFTAIDAKDTAAFLDKLSPTAMFRFGAAPDVQVKEAIGSAVDGFFSSIAALSHRVKNQVGDGSLLACEGDVSYTRHDGSSITLPFSDFFEFDGDLIVGYRVYIEIAPLYAISS
jgi:hypothetical protein